MVRKARFWFVALFLLAGLAAKPAAAATVFYDVYAGTGTTGTLLLGFQVPNVIPTSFPGEAIANVIGSDASSSLLGRMHLTPQVWHRTTERG